MPVNGNSVDERQYWQSPEPLQLKDHEYDIFQRFVTGVSLWVSQAAVSSVRVRFSGGSHTVHCLWQAPCSEPHLGFKQARRESPWAFRGILFDSVTGRVLCLARRKQSPNPRMCRRNAHHSL